MTEPRRPLQGVSACMFDAYGTLFDFASAAARCADVPAERRAALTALWRDKQLQYTWLRTLENRYVDFWQVTGEALDFALESLDLASPRLARAADGALSRPRAVPGGSRRPRRVAQSGIQDRHSLERFAGDAGRAGRPIWARANVRRRSVGRRGSRVQDPSHGLPIRARHACLASPRDRVPVVQRLGRARRPRTSACASSGATATASARERLPGEPDFEIRTLAELPALLGAAK